MKDSPQDSAISISDITTCLKDMEGGSFMKDDAESGFVARFGGGEIDVILQIGEWKTFGLSNLTGDADDDSAGYQIIGAILPHGKIQVLEVFLMNLEETEYYGTLKVFAIKNEASLSEEDYHDALIDAARELIFQPTPEFSLDINGASA